MHGEEADADERSTMTAQIVITEKSSQAKDVRAAVGSRYGVILAAEGHLLDLCEPGEVNPAWKRWSAVLLKPDGLYVAKPATGGNKAAKLKGIRQALRTAGRVWLATDYDREGQLIGQEILEHCRYRQTTVTMRVQASRVSVRRCAAIEPRGSKRAESGFENHSVAQAARVSMTSSRPSARSAVSMRPTAVVWRGSSMRRTAFSSTPSRLARATRDRPLSRSARASAALAAVPAGTAT